MSGASQYLSSLCSFGMSSSHSLSLPDRSTSFRSAELVVHFVHVSSSSLVPSTKKNTPAMLGYFSWWRLPDSNWGHKALQASALPTELKRLATLMRQNLRFFSHRAGPWQSQGLGLLFFPSGTGGRTPGILRENTSGNKWKLKYRATP